MNYNEWAFHDITPIYLQLVKKVEYAILSTNISAGEELPSIRVMAKLFKNQSQYRNESIYAPMSKRFNYFFQKRTLFCD